MADTRMQDGAGPETEEPSKPFGPVAAVFLATGIAAVVLGLLTVLAEASEGISDALQWNARVGPLSGKTIGAVVVFAIVWVVLHQVWKTKDPDPRKVFLWTWILLAVGVLLTFPIFFQLFES
jgi:hypothetical protein